jgi:hypothetical protein
MVLATALITVAIVAKAQDEEFEELRILYMDEKYEKLISKSEKYTDDDDTRKDPTPYLYLSKAYYEISMREEFNEEYPPEKAFRNAMKWAAKYRRKDPEGVLFEENDMYFQELKKSAISEAGGLMSDQKYSRAKRYYDGICDFDPEDPGAWLMLGYCQLQIRNKLEAERNFEEAGKVMSTRDMTSLNSTERKLLLEGVLTYSDYLIAEGMRDSSQATLQLAYPALEGDAEFLMHYNGKN